MSPSPFSSNLLPSALIDPLRLADDLGAHAGRLDLCAIAHCASTNTLLMAALAEPSAVHLPVFQAGKRGREQALDASKEGFPPRHNLQKNIDCAAPAFFTGEAAVPNSAAAGATPRGLVLVADQQSAGRGRRGRVWLSSPAGSLTFSLAWPFARGTPLSGLSLMVGVAVRQALMGLGARGLGLKWPNDLLLARPEGFAKLGGVLIELSTMAGVTQAVIGIGLNLHTPEYSLSEVDQSVAGLDQAGLADATIDRHVLLVALLSALVDALDRFAVHGFAAFRDEWNAGNAFAGRELMLIHEGRADTAGRCLGVDAEGALQVATPQGELRWWAGDVVLPDGPSLRLLSAGPNDQLKDAKR